jgi:UDP-N-acetylmuramoylalanine--D-glutamate ligase
VTSPVVVLGFGVSGEAAVRHLLAEGQEVLVLDDEPSPRRRQAAARLGVELHETPSGSALGTLLGGVEEVVVSPGVPVSHPVFHLDLGSRLVGEAELAWRRAEVPIVAITGTNGKTTVTTLVASMLQASGIQAVAAGNIGVPLLDAVSGNATVVVAEVSSFQLALSYSLRPVVGTWLNFAEDHLDWHPDIEHYLAAKARIWLNAGAGDLIVANIEDPVVMREAASASKDRRGQGAPQVVTFGIGEGDFHRGGDFLVGPEGEHIVAVEDMARSLPHDIANDLAATATALGVGANLAGCRQVLEGFTGLPHRVELVGENDGVRYYDDSKATTPGAVLAAMEGFDSAVLIAGGRNKGMSLRELRGVSAKLRGVVAIGEAAREVEDAFRGASEVVVATSMHEAVERAVEIARSGDAVVLSPGCASFDWYGSYAERGEDFVRCVRELALRTGSLDPGGGAR